MVGQTVSHYKILEKLGAGGMGVVYKAQDLRLERYVALKFLPESGGSDDDRARFRREAKAASALDHRNICAVYEIDETADGRPFIAMAYCRGRTLRERLDEGLLDPAAVVELAIQCAEGLSHAHAQGVIHRDIKPGNLFLTDEGEIRLLDFGLARRATDASVTRSNVVGTAAYMSPEQISGKTVDERSDLWSLGATLYEVLTGRSPFEAPYEPALVYSIVHEEPRPLRELRPEVPAALASLVERTLHKDPDERPQDADELLAELLELRRELLAASDSGSRSRSRSSSRSRSVSRKTRRSHAWTATVALSAFGAAGLLSWLGWRLAAHEARPPDAPAVAVLPLSTLSSDPDDAYFGDGLTEELISRLARVRGLKVISRTSVMRYRESAKTAEEISRELGVEALVEGSVRTAGDDVRINLQLVEAATGRNLWAEVYDRRLDNALAVQGEIARSVAEALQAHLTPVEVSRLDDPAAPSPEAYPFYFRGRRALRDLSRSSLESARDYFLEALERDAGYSDAQAGLADAYLLLGYWGHADPAEVYPLARAAARHAVELNPDNAGAYAALGLIAAVADWEWDEAERLLRKALDLQPGNVDARQFLGLRVLAPVGRIDEALTELEEALELDPLSAPLALSLGSVQVLAGQAGEAEATFRQVLDSEPDSAAALQGLARAQLGADQPRAALETLARARTLAGPGPVLGRGLRINALARSGEREQALAELGELERLAETQFVAPFEFALAFAGLDDRPRTLEALEAALDRRDSRAAFTFEAPVFARLRNEPEFLRLRAKARLP